MVDMIPNCSDTTGAEWRDNICLIRINNDGNECGLWLIRAICHKTQNIWSAAAWIRKGFKWCHVFNTFYLCIKCISKRTFDHNNLKVHFMKMQNCRFMLYIANCQALCPCVYVSKRCPFCVCVSESSKMDTDWH